MSVIKLSSSLSPIMMHDVLHSGNFEWHLEPHANVTFIHLLETDAPVAANLEFKLGQSSILNYSPIIIGGSHTELKLEVILHEHAQLTVAGAYALTGKEECSFTTQQMHCGLSSISNLVINGIAAGGALVTYNGAISIQKNATKSIARQENKTLLIGSRAKAISIPSLEVQTNDVQCAHGSAVGPLQEDQLTYAQSRGLSLHSARRMLVTSFFAQALEGMLDENLREKIVAQLVDKALGEKGTI